jgi:hypothetical protein
LPEDKLHDAIDETATALLAQAQQSATLDADGKPVDCTLFIEQVRAFDAVVKWAEVRHKLKPPTPPEREPSQLERIKQQFNGPASERRRNPRKTKPRDGDAETVFDSEGSADGDSTDGTNPDPAPSGAAEPDAAVDPELAALLGS